MTAATEWADRAAALRDELVAAGKLTSPGWEAAVLAVPRHRFVPSYYVARDGSMVEVDATNDGWLDTVYSNTALVTKISFEPDGQFPEFLSSSSMPGLMTRMLESLDVRDGHRVLEIGTGTGYNAALLCHRLGGEHVYSIDVEPELVDLARARLAELGYYPTIEAGDGAAGLPLHAPFDRVIATCSVPRIPWPWVEQVTLGGVILVDVRLMLNGGNLVRLTRTHPQRAEGRFDAGVASFMGLRHEPGNASRVPYQRLGDDAPAIERSTTRDPRTPWSHPVVWFLAALSIGPHCRMGYIGNGQSHPLTAVFLSTPDGSRCEIDLAADDDGSHVVRESGPVALWAAVESAYEQWDAAGQPDWPQLGLTVTPDEQWIWVDEPDSSVSWPL